MIEGCPNGKGKMVYASGAEYEGDWKNGLYHGVGRFKYRTGSVYEG